MIVQEIQNLSDRNEIKYKNLNSWQIQKRRSTPFFSFVISSRTDYNQISYEDVDKVRDVIFFVVVGCKLLKRHYFSGLSLDIEAIFLNSTFYFCRIFFSASRKGFEVDFQNLT